MNLAAIWSFLKILPELMSLVKRLIREHKERLFQRQKEQAEKSHQKMEEAKTIEEIQNANRDVTRNLP